MCGAERPHDSPDKGKGARRRRAEARPEEPAGVRPRARPLADVARLDLVDAHVAEAVRGSTTTTPSVAYFSRSARTRSVFSFGEPC